MNILFKSFLSITGFIAISLLGNGQNNNGLENLQDPKLKTFSRYGDYNVNLFLGKPIIKVPIKVISVSGKDFPIELEYNAGGVLVDNHPDWVGLNWDISGPGMIIRQVKKWPDEYDLTTYDKHIIKGYYYSGSEIVDKTNYDYNYLKEKIYSDGEADVFYFSCFGLSGSFFLNERKEWCVSSDAGVIVECNGIVALPDELATTKEEKFFALCRDNYNLSPFSGFTVKTSDGTKYVFGGKTASIEFQNNFFTQVTGDWVATKWQLTKVILPSGQELIFNYEAGPFNCRLGYMNGFLSKTKLHKINGFKLPGTDDYEMNSDIYKYVFNLYPSLIGVAGKLIRPTYLKTIETPIETFSFFKSKSTELDYPQFAFIKGKEWQHHILLRKQSLNYPIPISEIKTYPFLYRSVGSDKIEDLMQGLVYYKLDSIVISPKHHYNTNSEITFSLSYRQDKTKRKLLNEISEINRNEKRSKGKWKFDYYDDSCLPGYLSEQVDNNGYINENTTKIFTEPLSVMFNNSFEYEQLLLSSRSCAKIDVLAQAGTLKSVTFPTGGWTLFEYQRNDYSSYVNDQRDNLINTGGNSYTGGIRIHRISSYENSNKPPIIKNYIYKTNPNNGLSSGVLTALPKYLVFNSTTNTESSKVSKVEEMRLYFSDYNEQFQFGNNGHISYSKVIEMLGDGSYTLYRYLNYDTLDVFDVKPSMIYTNTVCFGLEFQPRASERGQLAYQSCFDSNGNKIYRKAFTYGRFNEKSGSSIIHGTSSYQSIDYQGQSNGEYNAFFAITYKRLYYLFLKTKIEEEFYFNNKVVNKSFSFDYNDIGLLKSEMTKQSDGNILRTEYRYPKDVNNYDGPQPTDPTTRAIVSMSGPVRNMLNYPIEILKYNNGELVGARINTYQFFSPGNVGPSLYQSYELDISSSISNYKIASFYPPSVPFAKLDFDTRFKLRTVYDKYDEFGNVLQFHKDGDIVNSYAYDYNCRLPVAHVINAPSGSWSFYSVDASDFNGVWQEGASIVEFPENAAIKVGKLSGGNYCHIDRIIPSSGLKPNTRYFVEIIARVEGYLPKAGLKLNINGEWPSAVFVGNNQFQTLRVEISTGNQPTDLLVSARNNIDAITTTEGSIYILGYRIYPIDAQITSYTWKPGVGVTSQTDHMGLTTTYEYDGLGRLIRVRDSEGKVIQEHRYKYATEQ